MAVIAANLELADVIQNHRPEDVGKLTRFELFFVCQNDPRLSAVCTRWKMSEKENLFNQTIFAKL